MRMNCLPSAMVVAAGLGVCGLLMSLSGCTTPENDPSVRAPRAMAPVGGAGRGGQPILTPPSDLTEEGSWARGTAPVQIIDTRLFDPQINPVVTGPDGPRDIREVLPDEAGDLPMQLGPGNDLPVGQLLASRRASVGARFPGIGQGMWVPPDPTIAVGPSHVVETVNSSIAWFTKEGDKQFETGLDGGGGFFGEVGAGVFVFDPKCFYDQYAQRYVVTALDVDFQGAGAWIVIAVSDDDDPNGLWYKYRTDCRVQVGDAIYWVDYPGFGFDADGIYITGNLFWLAGNGPGFAGAFYRSYDKSKLLDGQPAEYMDLRDATAASVQAVQHVGDNVAPMFVSVNSTALIKLQAIKNAFTAPLLVTATVPVPDFSFPGDAVPDRDGNWYDQMDARIINATSRNNRLVTGHGVGLDNRNVARWYEFDTHNWPESGAPTLVQAGNIDAGEDVHTWFPALLHDKWGSIGAVFGMASDTTYPSVQFAGRLPNDPAGTMGAIQEAQLGTRGSGNWRWGDYFDMALDPDETTLWLIGEYVTRDGWQTWISSFSIICAGDFNGDGTVNSRDVIAFLNEWAAQGDRADWNDDGAVNTRDVIAFLNDYAAGGC